MVSNESFSRRLDCERGGGWPRPAARAAIVVAVHVAVLAVLLRDGPPPRRKADAGRVVVSIVRGADPGRATASPAPPEPGRTPARPRPAVRNTSPVAVAVPPRRPALPVDAAAVAPRQVASPVGGPLEPTVASPAPVEEVMPERAAAASAPAPMFASEPTPAHQDADAFNNRAPAYPPESRRRHEQGLVTLRVFVAADGSAQEVVLQRSSGHPSLDHAAAEAVATWRFAPARDGDRAVADWLVVPIRFKLRER